MSKVYQTTGGSPGTGGFYGSESGYAGTSSGPQVDEVD